MERGLLIFEGRYPVKSCKTQIRPVSLLCIVSKVMEKVVNTAIMNYLERNNLLSAHQFGFRSGLSAADLLTSLNHQWLSCINSGGAVRVLAVDIAGAFDKVSHIGVLHKLRAYGICGALHQWLTDYLAFRNLQAVVGGATSSTFPVTAGVPQGSILGPTLFLIYVNDAPEVLPRGVMPATYADDTTLFSLVANAVDAAEDCNALQAGTDALSTWGTTWRIQFEPTKSQAMTISRHRQPLPIAPLRFGGVAVEEVTTLRLFGCNVRQHHELRPTSSISDTTCHPAHWLSAKGVACPGSAWPPYSVLGLRKAPYGVLPPRMERSSTISSGSA